MASINIEMLKKLLNTEKGKTSLVIPVWGLAIATVYAQALYQRAYLTLFDYGLVLAVCIIAGAIINDFARALLGFVAAMIIGMAILFILTTLPALTGQVSVGTSDVIFSIWTVIVFTSVFPFPLIAYLISSVIGSALGEKYL